MILLENSDLTAGEIVLSTMMLKYMMIANSSLANAQALITAGQVKKNGSPVIVDGNIAVATNDVFTVLGTDFDIKVV